MGQNNHPQVQQFTNLQQQPMQYTNLQQQPQMQQQQYTNLQQPQQQPQVVVQQQPQVVVQQQQPTYQVHVYEDQFGRLIDTQGNQVDANGTILVPAHQVQWGQTTQVYQIGMPNVYLVGGVPRYMKTQRHSFHCTGMGPQRRVVVRPNGNVVVRNGNGNRTVYHNNNNMHAQHVSVQQRGMFRGPTVRTTGINNNGAFVQKTVSGGGMLGGPRRVDKHIVRANGATVDKHRVGNTVVKTITRPNGRVVTKVVHKNGRRNR
jgi:hypothetical protein